MIQEIKIQLKKHVDVLYIHLFILFIIFYS